MYHKIFINCKPVIISVMMNVTVFFANLIQNLELKVRYKKNPTYAHSLITPILFIKPSCTILCKNLLRPPALFLFF
jgi:hypothetical protein